MLKRFIAILTLILISANILFATKYYVSTTGNNSANGSQTAPWLTVQKAASSMVSGDIVNIAPGTYQEIVTVSASNITFIGPATVKQFNVTGNYATITNLNIGTTSTTSDAVMLLGVGDRVMGCAINLHSKPYGAIYIAGSDCIVSDCDITGCYAVQAVVFTTSARNSLVTGCNLHDMHDVDVFRVWGVSNTLSGNTVYDCDNPGYSSIPWHADFIQTFGDNGETAYNITIESNYVHDCTTQIGNLTSDVGNIHDFTFRNNIFANISNCAFVGVKSFWYNNTFYKCGINQDCALYVYQVPNYNSAGSEIVNNVFLQCGNPASTSSGGINANGAVLSNYRIEHNYFAGNNYAAKSEAYIGTSAINGGDPKLVSVGSDFHLQSGSPLIGAATNLSTYFTRDKDGKFRPAAGAWDIGAYEQNGVISSIIPPTVSAISLNASDIDPNTAGL
ncbi:MAG: choice-of-anchor Q domain-containing protein [Verrucomicrobiales bacterium]|nr:choice-of-anchor Q domain-containing protein [Verrucomicrobiales bacterium]